MRDFLRGSRCVYDDVNVIGADMGGVERSASILAHAFNGAQHDLPARAVEQIRRVLHGLAFKALQRGLCGSHT